MSKPQGFQTEARATCARSALLVPPSGFVSKTGINQKGRFPEQNPTRVPAKTYAASVQPVAPFGRQELKKLLSYFRMPTFCATASRSRETREMPIFSQALIFQGWPRPESIYFSYLGVDPQKEFKKVFPQKGEPSTKMPTSASIEDQ